ncbi:hypothetical protein ElyMa_004416000 [Elysia marginata]|uniref:Uncharacterized protein n=1 Tax=Elysia marginata TaxID=1093978 RepID=A0AAV4HCZ4_9GAST|nr:hypothetical protein ElyMa_004416000 [Elysia marginata]
MVRVVPGPESTPGASSSAKDHQLTMRKQAKGWTHPEHWIVATVATVVQFGAVILFIVAAYVTPSFTDRRAE